MRHGPRCWPQPRQASFPRQMSSWRRIVEACVDICEMATGYRVNLIERPHFGVYKRYTARLMRTEVNVPIDRAMPLEIQAFHMEHYLQQLKAKHEEWRMGHELRKLIKLHGVVG